MLRDNYLKFLKYNSDGTTVLLPGLLTDKT